MPKTNLNKKPRDHVLELICGRLRADEELNVADMAEKVGVSDKTLYRYLKTPTDQWKLGTLKKVCKYLEIPIDELRSAIRWN